MDGLILPKPMLTRHTASLWLWSTSATDKNNYIYAGSFPNRDGYLMLHDRNYPARINTCVHGITDTTADLHPNTQDTQLLPVAY